MLRVPSPKQSSWLLDMTGQTIYSLSSIHTLSHKNLISKTALNCHGALNKLTTSNTVNVLWLAWRAEAHTGHWGNERADKMANLGTIYHRHLHQRPPSVFLYTNAASTAVMERSEQAWSNTSHVRMCLTFGSNSKTTNEDFHRPLDNRTDYSRSPAHNWTCRKRLLTIT